MICVGISCERFAANSQQFRARSSNRPCPTWNKVIQIRHRLDVHFNFVKQSERDLLDPRSCAARLRFAPQMEIFMNPALRGLRLRRREYHMSGRVSTFKTRFTGNARFYQYLFSSCHTSTAVPKRNLGMGNGAHRWTSTLPAPKSRRHRLPPIRKIYYIIISVSRWSEGATKRFFSRPRNSTCWGSDRSAPSAVNIRASDAARKSSWQMRGHER